MEMQTPPISSNHLVLMFQGLRDPYRRLSIHDSTKDERYDDPATNNNSALSLPRYNIYFNKEVVQVTLIPHCTHIAFLSLASWAIAMSLPESHIRNACTHRR